MNFNLRNVIIRYTGILFATRRKSLFLVQPFFTTLLLTRHAIIRRKDLPNKSLCTREEVDHINTCYTHLAVSWTTWSSTRLGFPKCWTRSTVAWGWSSNCPSASSVAIFFACRVTASPRWPEIDGTVHWTASELKQMFWFTFLFTYYFLLISHRQCTLDQCARGWGWKWMRVFCARACTRDTRCSDYQRCDRPLFKKLTHRNEKRLINWSIRFTKDVSMLNIRV